MNQQRAAGGHGWTVTRHRPCKILSPVLRVGLLRNVGTDVSHLSVHPAYVSQSCVEAPGLGSELPWHGTPLGDRWGPGHSQSPLRAPWPLMSMEPFIASSLPGCCHSSWPEKSRTRLGFSMTFIDFILLWTYCFNGPYSKGLIVWSESVPVF